MKIKRKKEETRRVIASGTLTVLFVENKISATWSAQCLEHDIAAQGKTLVEVDLEMRRMIVSHLEIGRLLGRKPFKGINKAPQIFFDLYAKSQMKFNQPVTTTSTRNRESIGYPRVHEMQAAVAAVG